MPPMMALAMLPAPIKEIVGDVLKGHSRALVSEFVECDDSRNQRFQLWLCLGGLAPKRAVPTRTQVAPSAMAISRSSDMPIDSVSIGPASGNACLSSRRVLAS